MNKFFPILASVAVVLAFCLSSCNDDDNVVDALPENSFLVKNLSLCDANGDELSHEAFYYDDQNRLTKVVYDHSEEHRVEYEYSDGQIVSKEYSESEVVHHCIYFLEDNRVVREDIVTLEMTRLYEYDDQDQLLSIVIVDDESPSENTIAMKQTWNDGNVVVLNFAGMDIDIEYTSIPLIVNYTPINGILWGYQGKVTKNLLSRSSIKGAEYCSYSYEMDELGRPAKYFRTVDGKVVGVYTLTY